ncbi:MAG TPA: DinB family protein [Ignavibacteria bacterium]|nr:DinB family protein [Ignavibacteria bacterium]HRK00390.1 DinB family protein [Ignavibacteria bacterium]
MNTHEIINQLDSNSLVFKNLLSGVPEKLIHRKPSGSHWSLLEIVCHLYDEEKEDFRPRLAKIIAGDHNWDLIDPQDWVLSRKYSEKDFDSVLKDFLYERSVSVEWLKSLDVNFRNLKVTQPVFGEFSAIKMLSEWLAHDLLHIRQILKLKFDFLNESLQPDAVSYAGKW